MTWLGRGDRDYREELEAHLEMEVRENLDRGMSPNEARHAALRTFGNTLAVRQKLAEGRPLHVWETLSQDLRYGARLLKRSPGMTAAIVVTLALGIGANAAIFSLVEAVMLRMLPVREPHSLVIVRALSRQGVRDSFSHTDYEWLRDHAETFSAMSASAVWTVSLDAGDRKERVTAQLVSGSYFEMLGVAPAAGRAIMQDDDRQGRRVAVLSHAYWQRAFGGRDDALGKDLKLDRTWLTIVGVAPPGFNGEFANNAPDFWLPLGVQPAVSGPERSYLNTRNASWLEVMGRLRPGVTVAQARAGMQPLLESLRADLRVDSQNDYLGGIAIEPGGGGLSSLRDYYAQPLRVLMALVGLVLLIACANVANLLLARSAARRREFAVRLAIGAGRARVVRQLLTESFLLAAMASVAGLATAEGIVQILLAVSEVQGLDVHVNLPVLAFTVAISCAAAIAFGLAPALQSKRIDPWPTLKDGTNAAGTGARFSPSRLLVVTQTALSLVLLIAAGLLLRTFLNLKAIDPGFDEQVLEANLDTSLVSGNGVVLPDALLERLSSLPGVESASFSQFGFGRGASRICCISLEGYVPRANEDKNVRVHSVSPEYFRSMSIPLIAGRPFSHADRDGAPSVAIINETMARRYFRGVDPLGKRFAWSPTDSKDTEIVGVVKDAKYDNLRQDSPRLVYLSALQQDSSANFVQIRGRTRSERELRTLLDDSRAAIRAVNPSIRIVSLESLAAAVNRTLAPERLVSWLSMGFGVLALILTSIGLYGILAYSVVLKTTEFGIRMALGAGRLTILRMVMKEALVLVSIGLMLGLTAAGLLANLGAKLLFEVHPRDTSTFVLATSILILVAVAAGYGPARRATRVEPVTALRNE
ncbi:MAG TPA: ABC transporter permease [Vicinamibacterales bacterium]|jgi:predicted permease